VVVAGSIRSPSENDALSVTLTIGDTEITMRADGTELGGWPAEAVAMRRIDATAFEFIAEGDRMIFTPEDPSTFGGSPIVGGPGAATGSRTGRRSKKRLGGAEAMTTERPVSPEDDRRSRRRTANGSSKESPAKPSRRLREATAEAARADELPVAPPADPEPIDAAHEEGRPALASEPDEVVATETKGKSNRAWIRAIDIARKYDTFGLDRVPVDESLRGQEHQHTWDHRVAAKSGLGKHICTICGAIRR
jgi:hypothetical protein